MDDRTFDRWTRSLARGTSRRRLVATWAAGAVALFAGRRVSAQETPTGITVSRTFCGGFAGLPCPDGYACVDLRGDSCDPERGGRDCMGICVPAEETNPCAAITCLAGSVCCPQCGGRCVGPDIDCETLDCAGEPCGGNVCMMDEYCCNESCGICAPLGGSCTEQYCGGEQCGSNVCGAGEYCCNESCSICAPTDGLCTQQVCIDSAPTPYDGVPCDGVICPPGEVCCNTGCGICTKPDGPCPAIICP